MPPTATATGVACVPVTASADDGNVAANVLDGDLNTRWSASGDGQWIQFCLGNPVPVNGVKIAFYNGDQRKAFFDLQLSGDGINFTTAAAGLQSSGTSLQLETFALAGQTAKYVRILGHGNSSNAWNSYTEVVVLTGASSPTPTPTATPVAATVWRVNAGGPAYTDSQGQAWSADTNFSGGNASVKAATVSGTQDSTLYQSYRTAPGTAAAVTYTFDATPGNYQVTLKFAENYWTAAGQRVFNVSVNGAQVLSNFDIFAAAGGKNIAVDEVFSNVSPQGGVITVVLGPASVDTGKVNAIQIVPQGSLPSKPSAVSQGKTPTPTPTAVSPSGLRLTDVVPYPNPATGRGATLSYRISGTESGQGEVTLRLYTLTGRLVWSKTLTGSAVKEGEHGVDWDGKDFSGSTLANGVYYYTATLEDSKGRDVHKTPLLILK